MLAQRQGGTDGNGHRERAIAADGNHIGCQRRAKGGERQSRVVCKAIFACISRAGWYTAPCEEQRDIIVQGQRHIAIGQKVVALERERSAGCHCGATTECEAGRPDRQAKPDNAGQDNDDSGHQDQADGQTTSGSTRAR